MSACCAYGCKNRPERDRKRGVTFHKFPKEESLRKQWIAALRRKDYVPSKWAHLCSEHFEESVIDRTAIACVRLREGAIPSIFRAFPSYLQRSVRKRKPPTNRTHSQNEPEPHARPTAAVPPSIYTLESPPDTATLKTKLPDAEGKLANSKEKLPTNRTNSQIESEPPAGPTASMPPRDSINSFESSADTATLKRKLPDAEGKLANSREKLPTNRTHSQIESEPTAGPTVSMPPPDSIHSLESSADSATLKRKLQDAEGKLETLRKKIKLLHQTKRRLIEAHHRMCSEHFTYKRSWIPGGEIQSKLGFQKFKTCTEENTEGPIAVNYVPRGKSCVVLSDKSLVKQWMFVGIEEKLVEDSDIAQFLLSLYFRNEKKKPAVKCVECHSELLPVWKCPNCLRHYAFDPTQPQNGSAEKAAEDAGDDLQSPILQCDSVNLLRSFKYPFLDSSGVVADVNQIHLLQLFDQENTAEPQNHHSLILDQKKGGDNIFSFDSATCLSDTEETRLHSSAPKLTSRSPIMIPFNTVVKPISDQNELLSRSVAVDSQVINDQTAAMTKSSDQQKNSVIGLVLPPSDTASPRPVKPATSFEFLTNDRISLIICPQEINIAEKSCSISQEPFRCNEVQPNCGQSMLTASGQTTGFSMTINSKGDQTLSQTVARDWCSDNAASPKNGGCVSSKLSVPLKMICQYSIDNQKVPKDSVNLKIDKNGDQSMHCQKKEVLIGVALPPNKKLLQSFDPPQDETLLACNTPLVQEIATDSPVECSLVYRTYASNTTALTGEINDVDTPGCDAHRQLDENQGNFHNENIESNSQLDHTVENQHVFCHSIYSSRNKLKRHLSSTNNKKTNYVCEICSKVFLSYGELFTHQMSHGHERRYLCDVCGKKFITSSSFKDHSFIHLDHRPYKCKGCVKSFKTKRHLQAHSLTHTGEKKFICEVCGRAFARAAHVRSHQTHHKKVNYCPY